LLAETIFFDLLLTEVKSESIFFFGTRFLGFCDGFGFSSTIFLFAFKSLGFSDRIGVVLQEGIVGLAFGIGVEVMMEGDGNFEEKSDMLVLFKSFACETIDWV
jgi:hypothetical protein